MSRSTNTATRAPTATTPAIYNAVERFPVFQSRAITMRRDPIYLSTFTGRPPDEPSMLGEALNEVFIPLLQQQFPEIVDFWLPPEGCSYRIAVVSMKKAYPGHAKRVMMGVWSFLRQFVYTKFVDRGGRRHRRARLEGRDVGDLDAHGPGARHHRWSRTRRSTISTSPRPNPGLAARSASTPPTSCRPRPSAYWGTHDPHGRRRDRRRHPRNGRATACPAAASRSGK